MVVVAVACGQTSTKRTELLTGIVDRQVRRVMTRLAALGLVERVNVGGGGQRGTRWKKLGSRQWRAVFCQALRVVNASALRRGGKSKKVS